MDSIPKLMASIITIIIGVLLCISFIISSVVVNSARTYHSSVIEEIEASNFDEATIQKCKDAAKKDNYILSVEKTTTNESEPHVLYKVTLNYGLYAPIFGRVHQGELVGYAQTGAKVGGGGSDNVAETIAPGLYETGSNYTVLLKPWSELVAEGIVKVTDGVVSTVNPGNTNPSSDALAGDLMLPYDGSITEVANKGFLCCKLLTGVKLPDSVFLIGEEAFAGCYTLDKVELGSDLATIGYGAFDYAPITKVNYHGYIHGWCSIDVDSQNSNPLYCGADLYFYDTLVTDVVIPADTDSLAYRLHGCSSMKTLVIPDNMSITDFPSGVFKQCYNLESVVIGDGIISLGSYSFSECYNLKSVTIPSSVTTIKSYCFGWCSAITDINYSGTMEQWNAITFGSNWNKDMSGYTIHCTDGDIA